MCAAGGIDTRPTTAVRVQGHLLDKALLNRLLDIAVDSPCDFEVEDLVVAPSNDLHSTAVIRLWGTAQSDLDTTVKIMNQLVEGNAPIAECTLTIVDTHSGTAKLQDDLPL